MSAISGYPFRGEPPLVEWFASGSMERRKFDEYLLSSTHPGGRDKLRLWRSIFGFNEGDGELLERLIREQLAQAKVVERESTVDRDDPEIVYLRWRLDIPRFRGPNGAVGPVRTQWALVPKRSRPHLTTSYPLVY